jgi:uncharacterized protein
MTRSLSRAFLILLLPVLASAAQAREVPYLSGRVVDEAAMIPADARQRIEQKLAAFEQRTGSQVAVLTIESLQGDPLEDFSQRTVETWKLGKAGKDNGVLFLVSEQDRQMRIEVGYGLEPELTDAESGRILANVVRPAFRNGDFGGGIEKGVDSVLSALGGAEVPAAAPEPAVGPGVPAGFKLIVLFILGVFSLAAISSAGCQGWFLYVFLMPFYLMFGNMVFPGIGLVPVIVWAIAFPILKMLLGPSMARSSRGRRGGGGFFGGPFIGGGFGGGFGGRGGGGGFGGGGFSGGGGSFGGGGASGSW